MFLEGKTLDFETVFILDNLLTSSHFIGTLRLKTNTVSNIKNIKIL